MTVRSAPYAGNATVGEVLNAADVNNLNGGWYGYVEVTANQTPITTEADLTGLSVAVTVPANRRIKITGFVSSVKVDAADNRVRLRIKEGATTLQVAEMVSRLTATSSASLQAVVILTPTTGAHTYKLSLERDQGAGNAGMLAAAGQPAFLFVEDAGPAS